MSITITVGTIGAKPLSADVSLTISDVPAWLRSLEADDRDDLLTGIAEVMGGSDIVDALADHAAAPVAGVSPLTDRGTAILDCFVERAAKLCRLPEDFEPKWVAGLRLEADRLQRQIVEGDVDGALATLRDMVPDHPFLSPQAEKMLAGIHQGAML